MGKIGLKDLKPEIAEALNSISDIIERLGYCEQNITTVNNTVISHINTPTSPTNNKDDRVDAIIQVINTLSRAINNIPKIPTKLSELQNDVDYITSDTYQKLNFNNPNFTGTATVNNKTIAVVNDIPNKTSQLNNDAGYIKMSDINLDAKANKATNGYNQTLETQNSFPFIVSGDKVAGYTFQKTKYKVNFGLDENNDLCIGGGSKSDKEVVITDKSILNELYNAGIYLMKVADDGSICVLRDNSVYELVYDDITKKIILRGRE